MPRVPIYSLATGLSQERLDKYLINLDAGRRYPEILAEKQQDAAYQEFIGSIADRPLPRLPRFSGMDVLKGLLKRYPKQQRRNLLTAFGLKLEPQEVDEILAE